MRTCPTCGTKLALAGNGGICPRCFLREGLLAVDFDAGADVPASQNHSLSTQPSQTGALSDYEMLEEIARGGMGVVWKARQRSLNRLVAVKMMLLGPWAGADYVRRFRLEAQAAASLQHPNIVAIHEVGERDGQPFFSMDYVEGRSLAELTRGNPLPARRAAAYLKKIAEAVHYAHRRGILHRDLKPANILIDAADEPRITDFGLAKRITTDTGGQTPVASVGGGAPESGLQLPASALSDFTLSGQVLGSPNYLPPEQAEGRSQAASPASDVYALGAVLYYLLTGRPPFQAERVTDILQQVSHSDPVAPGLLNPSVPKDLETICLKCLEKEPVRRYPTAQVLADELGRFLAEEPILAHPVSRPERTWRWCRRRPVLAGLAAALVAVFALGLGGVLWQWRKAERERQWQRLYAYTSDMKAAQVALAQDNRGMAMSLLRHHVPQRREDDLRGLEWRFLWQQARGDEWRSFPHPAMVHSAAISPDGSQVATMSHDARLRVWEVRSGHLAREFDSAWFMTPYQSVTFSPDGLWLAAIGSRGVDLRDTTHWAVQRQLSTAGGPLCFAPDSGRLAAMGTNTVELWDVPVLRREELGCYPVRYCSLAFTPDGHQLATAQAVPAFDTAAPVRLHHLDTCTQQDLADSRSVVSVRVSPDGRWLAGGTWEGEVKLWALPGGELRHRLQAHHGIVLGLAFSPDGRLLASGGNDQSIHLWEVPGLAPHATLHGHLNEIHELAFASQGRMLVSASTDGTAKLWNLDALPPRRTGWNVPPNTSPIAPLPDGRTLLTLDGLQGRTQLWDLTNGAPLSAWKWEDFDRRGCTIPQFFVEAETVAARATNGLLHFWDLRTGNYQRAIQCGGMDFVPWRLSPSHRWLVGTTSNLWVFDLHGERAPVRLPDSFSGSATFSRDGQWLAYGGPAPAYTVTVWNLATAQPRTRLPGHRWYVRAARFSPDSHLLATGAMDGEVRLWTVPGGELLHPPLKGHQSRVNSVWFSADSRTLLTAGEDRTIRWWNVATGREMLCQTEARIRSNFAEIAYGQHSVETHWNPTGDIVAWLEGTGRVHALVLPTLAEIDALDRQESLLP